MKRICVAVLATALLATGCSTHKPKALEGPPVTSALPPNTYVAVGASESVGAGADSPLQEAWTKVVWASMARNTVYLDVAVPGYTAAQAVSNELPKAEALNANIVTVWLNANDAVAGVSASTYKAQMLTLLKGLRNNGKTPVYVANTPPLDQLPAYLKALNGDKEGTPFSGGAAVPQPAQLNALVDSYNKAITDDANITGAKVVNIASVFSAAQANGTASTLIAADGFHPSTAGHAAVAKAFIAAINS